MGSGNTRPRRPRGRARVFLASKDALSGTLTAPPVGLGWARSHSDRIAEQLGGGDGPADSRIQLKEPAQGQCWPAVALGAATPRPIGCFFGLEGRPCGYPNWSPCLPGLDAFALGSHS
jgi:hypothetical protein